MANGRIVDPTDRESFKIYIRAKLGEPVIQLNVSEFQVDIAIDEALHYFQQFHYDGTEHAFYIHELTQQDIDNKSFTIPDDIVGVVTFFSMSSTSSSGIGLPTNVYSGAWQMNYDLIFNQGTLNGTFLTYYINKTYYEMIQQLVVGMNNLRYTLHKDTVYIDNQMSQYGVGDKIILDCWRVVDPDANPQVWSDRWLIRYATAKLKKQWGENISKFGGMTLPGGVQLNGERILREADEELKYIEESCIRDYSDTPRDFLA